MKQTLFSVFFLVVSAILFAQAKKTSLKKLYVDGGTGPSNHNGAFGEGGVTAIFKNNWMVSASAYQFDIDPKNLPSDYQAGYTVFFPFTLPDEWPSERMSLFNVTGGKLFQLGRKTWVTTEAGLSIASGEKMSFTQQPIKNSGFYFSSNYSIQKESQTTIGGLLKTDFNWAFTPYVGLSVGGFVDVNSIQSPAGIEFKLIAGWLNTKKKPRK